MEDKCRTPAGRLATLVSEATCVRGDVGSACGVPVEGQDVNADDGKPRTGNFADEFGGQVLQWQCSMLSECTPVKLCSESGGRALSHVVMRRRAGTGANTCHTR